MGQGEEGHGAQGEAPQGRARQPAAAVEVGRMTPLTFQDWACGCGGWTEGLVQAGLRPVLGIDSWNIAAQSHHDNFFRLGCRTLVERIENITLEMLPDTDVIVGSPPCQANSIAH